MVFGGLLLVKPSFSREKDGFSKDGCSKQSFSREKDGFEPKNHLFLEKTKKTKKTKKNHLFQNYGAGAFKRCFFGFFVFLVRFLFLEKKMVFGGLVPGKTIFFSRKRWFLEERLLKNHLFLEKKMVSNQKIHLFLEKTKKTIFWGPQPHSFGKDGFFGFFVFFGFLDFFGLLVFVSFLFCCFLP